MKQVHWQVPFCSQSGTKYRIDIYAEGDAEPQTLLGAENVFSTEEDNSNDYFCPVRTQTGTIRLVDKDGSLLERIIPDNNLAHPIRVINTDTETVEWQGFLGCEAYTQKYTARTQELSISVISVLEALKSVELDTAVSDITRINTLLYSALHRIEEVEFGGIAMWSGIYFPSDIATLLSSHYIDGSCMFEQKEICNESSVRYEVNAKSCYDFLYNFCRFFGLTVRENKSDICFIKYANKKTSFASFANLMMAIVPWRNLNKAEMQMSEFGYKGEDHSISISQGAKSVEVVAKLVTHNLDLSLPSFPTGNNAPEIYKQLKDDYIYLLASNYLEAYGDVRFSFWRAYMRYMYAHIESSASSTLANTLLHMYATTTGTPSWTHAIADSLALVNFYSGAFHARVAFDDGEQTAHDTLDGIYCVFLPHMLNSGNDSGAFDFNPDNFDAIFSINSIVPLCFPDGYINLNMAMNMLFWSSENGGEINHSDEIPYTWKMMFELQFGQKWWNGSAWQSTRCPFEAKITANNFKGNWDNTMEILETEGLLIPVDFSNRGVITFGIWPPISALTKSESDNPLEAFISRLNATFIPKQSVSYSERKDNHYYRILGLNYRDEISIDCELASDLSNAKSPSIILDANKNTITELNYIYDSGNVKMRPEIELLNRLESFYKANRRTIELEIEQPAGINLPMRFVKGYDGRTYVPVSISTEWQENRSKAMLIEMPEQRK